MIIQFLCNSKCPARFFSVPRASKVYHRRFRLFDFTGHYYWPLFSPIMRPPSYRQRLFVEYDLGEIVEVRRPCRAPSWVSMA